MSRRVTVLVAGLVPLLAAAVLSAASAPSVDDVVARYVSARGGLKKIRAIQTLRQKGQATAGASRVALVTRELARPAKARFEFTIQGVTGVYVSDGAHGWQVSPFDGDMQPVEMPDDAVREAVEQADIEGPLVDWKAKGHRVELVGRETVDGREAYKLKVILKSGAVRYEFVDGTSFYLVRTDTTRQVRGRAIPIRTTFGDFKKTAGVVFPRRIEVEAEGRPNRLSIVVDSIEVNPRIDDARFEIQAAPKR